MQLPFTGNWRKRRAQRLLTSAAKMLWPNCAGGIQITEHYELHGLHRVVINPIDKANILP